MVQSHNITEDYRRHQIVDEFYDKDEMVSGL